MHVIKRKKILDFIQSNKNSETALNAWYRLVKKESYANFVALRNHFPHADQVGKLTVFNIGGNKYRLIAAIHYNTKKIFIREILTHQEYDKNKWKEA